MAAAWWGQPAWWGRAGQGLGGGCSVVGTTSVTGTASVVGTASPMPAPAPSPQLTWSGTRNAAQTRSETPLSAFTPAARSQLRVPYDLHQGKLQATQAKESFISSLRCFLEETTRACGVGIRESRGIRLGAPQRRVPTPRRGRRVAPGWEQCQRVPQRMGSPSTRRAGASAPRTHWGCWGPPCPHAPPTALRLKAKREPFLLSCKESCARRGQARGQVL